MGNSHGRFVWYELLTTDIEAAKAFYANVIGWSTRDASMPAMAYSLFTVEDAPVAGVMKLPEEAHRLGAPPHWAGYIGVDDVGAAVARVQQLGGSVHVPPTEVPNVSCFSIVADPQMSTFALVKGRQPAREQKGTPLDQPGHVGWHELLATDWESAFAFYAALLGWQKAESHLGAMGTYQRFAIGGEVMGGMFSKPESLPFPFWLYYFKIADIEAAALRVEAAGGQVIYGPTAVPGGARIVQCMDPQGAVFGLVDRRKAIGYSVSGAA